MLKHWRKLFYTDCVVLVVGAHTVYPIFRVGSTSLRLSSSKSIVNEQIKSCAGIEVLLRNPDERFISGLNEYCRQHGLDVRTVRERLESEQIIDRHFAPQYLWLVNLYRFYKGDVTLRSFDYIKKITNLHVFKDKVNLKKIIVEPVPAYVEVDRHLLDHVDQKVNLGNLIKEYKNVLS